MSLNLMDNALKARAIDINVSFTGIMDLTRHTRKLAINAQVASSRIGAAGEPFAVLVQELIVMSEELTKMISEVEALFGKIVLQVAKWNGEVKKQKFYSDALHLIKPIKNESSSEEDIEITPEEDDFQIQDYTTGYLEEEIKYSKSTIIEQRDGLFNNARKLASLLEGVRSLTQKHSKYLAITARVEAVRVSEHGEDLIIVAENISKLTEDIALIHEKAESDVLLLLKEVEKYKKYLKMENSSKGMDK